jgi:hypothetical protein
VRELVYVWCWRWGQLGTRNTKGCEAEAGEAGDTSRWQLTLTLAHTHALTPTRSHPRAHTHVLTGALALVAQGGEAAREALPEVAEQRAVHGFERGGRGGVH